MFASLTRRFTHVSRNSWHYKVVANQGKWNDGCTIFSYFLWRVPVAISQFLFSGLFKAIGLVLGTILVFVANILLPIFCGFYPRRQRTNEGSDYYPWMRLGRLPIPAPGLLLAVYLSGWWVTSNMETVVLFSKIFLLLFAFVAVACIGAAILYGLALATNKGYQWFTGKMPRVVLNGNH